MTTPSTTPATVTVPVKTSLNTSGTPGNTPGRARLGNRTGRTGIAGAGALTPARERWLKVVGVVVFFGAWELLPWVLRVDTFVLPPPSVIWRTLVAEIAAGRVAEHVLVTMGEFGLAIVLASAVGITLGVVAGRVRVADSALDPFVWFLYATPVTAVYPLLILWVGLGFKSVLLIAFLLSVVPVVINTTVGVKNANDAWVRVGRSFMASRWQMLRKIIIPGAFPIILAGIRLAVGRALTGVVIGEMFGANTGLGFRIAENAARIRIPAVFAYLLLIVAFGVVVTQAFSVIEARLLRHQPQSR